MRFGGLETFNSINSVPSASCGQRKAKLLNQEPRTWRTERKNFGKYCDTNICRLLQESTSNKFKIAMKLPLETLMIEITTY